ATDQAVQDAAQSQDEEMLSSSAEDDSKASAPPRAGDDVEKTDGRRPAIATVIAGLLAVLLTGGAVLAGLWWHGLSQDEERGQRALQAARDMAVSLVTVNAATADADVNRIMDGAVGDFGKIFSENM